jgi:hypothetical protein
MADREATLRLFTARAMNMWPAIRSLQLVQPPANSFEAELAHDDLLSGRSSSDASGTAREGDDPTWGWRATPLSWRGFRLA